MFEKERPDFFGQGTTGGPNMRQLCYTNPDLVAQVAQDARDFFDGKGIVGLQVAFGDYFAVIPLDTSRWCKCDRCQTVLHRDRQNPNGKHFASGTATHYWFGFVNAVAKEVTKRDPGKYRGKYIATLAYDTYSFAPKISP